MTKAIELAKKCEAYEYDNEIIFHADQLQAFYDAAQKEQIEKDAVIAWTHYMDVCIRKKINPSTFEEYLACSAIRNQLVKQNDV